MLKSIIIISAVVLSLHVQADARFNEAELSTLFSTPQLRSKIDTYRSRQEYSSDSIQQASPSTIKLNGLVRRSDGNTTVWVNGRSNIDQATVGGVKVPARQRTADSVAVYVDGEIVRIKPGDSWSQKKPDN